MIIYFLSSQLGVDALTQTTNWNFNGNSTGWTATNGTGTDTCGQTTTSSGTNMATFAYDGTIGNPAGSFKAVSGTVAATSYKGKITQTFVMPGSGTVKVKGRMDYYANSNKWSATVLSSWIRADIYDSTDTNFVTVLGCASFNSNQAWTTSAMSSNISLTGGTTYTIRVTFRALTKASSAGAITLAADNIIVTASPVGLTATATVGTSNTSLSWTVSTAGSGAPGLNAITPYKVYRDTSSPVMTFLGNATTNSFSDTSTNGNTTYYYAISNVDTNNIESPLASESAILTLPGAPGSPTFSNILDTSMRVNWTATTGGASSYKVERCTGSGCSNFSEIGSGITNLYLDNYSLSPGTTYSFRIRGTNGSGDSAYSFAAEQATTATVSVAVTTDGNVAYGIVAPSANKSTIDLAHTQTAKNDGNVTENFNIMTSNAVDGTTWTPGSSAGTNIYVHEFSTNGGVNWSVLSTGYQSFATGVTPNGTLSFDLRLTAPSSTSDYVQKNITVTIQAVQQ